jgi:hypothetical protein
MQYIYYMAAHRKFPQEEWDGYRESTLNKYEGSGSRKWWGEQK